MATMSLNFMRGSGGSDEVTATKDKILQGYTAITSDSDDEPIQGTMINRGTVNQTLNVSTPLYTIPQGYHSGSGNVSITTQEKSATPTTSTQNITPDNGKVLSKVTVNPTPTQEKTVYANTSAQSVTPDSGKFLSKVNVSKLSQSNFSAGNIRKGINISINNGNSNVFSATGTWYGTKKVIGVSAYDSSSGSENYAEQSFTMPDSGMVYYGGCTGGWYYADSDTNSTCAIYKNGTVMDNRNISSGANIFRGSMFNKSFSAAKGDVIKVVASCAKGRRGNFMMSCIQAVIVY